jgi:hypothetical protein
MDPQAWTSKQGVIPAIAARVKLSDAAKALVAHQSCSGYLAALDRRELYRDGLRFAAAALAAPQGVWWGCLCAWDAYRPAPPAKERAALAAVVSWIATPDESRRRAAEQAALAAGLDTPAGCLAWAVFVSGDSISLPNLPAVKPAPNLFGQTLATMVLMASTHRDPSQATARQRQYLALANDVGSGRSKPR